MPIVGSHQQAPVTIPINGTSPVDASEVRLNDNAIITNYNLHDSDAALHVQSSSLATRPLAGTVGRLWLVTDNTQLYYDNGTSWVTLKLDASSLTTGNVPSARVAGSYTGITQVGTLGTLDVTGAVTMGATLNVTGTLTAGALVGPLTGNVTGNADTATKLSGNRTFALTGDVTGSVSSDLTSGASIAASYAGTLPVNKGGTNLTAAPTNGQLLIGNGTGYTLATLTAGANTIITNAAGSITITSTGAGTGTTTRTVTVQTATAGQTTFSVTYNPGYIDAYLNGVYLTPGVDYTAATGTTVVLTTGAALNDELVFVTYTSLSLAGIVNGSGTSNYVPRWSNVNTLTNSAVQDDGSRITLGRSNLTLGSVAYAVPTVQGVSGTALVNDGSGNLSWVAVTSPGTLVYLRMTFR